jgi:hypothetical protein
MTTMDREDTVLVREHIEELTRRAEAGDHFCVKTLAAIMIIIGNAIDDGFTPPEGDDGEPIILHDVLTRMKTFPPEAFKRAA